MAEVHDAVRARIWAAAPVAEPDAWARIIAECLRDLAEVTAGRDEIDRAKLAARLAAAIEAGERGEMRAAAADARWWIAGLLAEHCNSGDTHG
jgi:hypothetical protein